MPRPVCGPIQICPSPAFPWSRPDQTKPRPVMSWSSSCPTHPTRLRPLPNWPKWCPDPCHTDPLMSHADLPCPAQDCPWIGQTLPNPCPKLLMALPRPAQTTPSYAMPSPRPAHALPRAARGLTQTSPCPALLDLTRPVPNITSPSAAPSPVHGPTSMSQPMAPTCPAHGLFGPAHCPSPASRLCP